MCCGGLQCNFVIWVKNTTCGDCLLFPAIEGNPQTKINSAIHEKGDQFDALYYKVLQINVYTNIYLHLGIHLVV